MKHPEESPNAIKMATDTNAMIDDDPDDDTDQEEELEHLPTLKHARRLAQNAAFSKLVAQRALEDVPLDSAFTSDEAQEEVLGLAGGVKTAAEMVMKGQAQKIINNAREYQTELFERAKETNTIAVLDTGSGKTLIAAMLIKHVLQQEYIDRGNGLPGRMVFFLVNTVTLVFQQHAMLVNNLEQDKIARFCGAMGVDRWGKKEWADHFKNYMVIVCTAEVLNSAMMHAYVTLSDISLLILDECHHAKKDHPYARLIKDYYLPANTESRLPRIFGMTASPVDARTDVSEASEALEMLLNAKIATTSNLSLDKHVHRPEEEIWTYDRLAQPFETELCREISNICTAKEIGKLKKFSLQASSELGRWCADYVWLLALNEKKEAMRIERSVERRWSKSTNNFIGKDTEVDSVRSAADVVRRWKFKKPKSGPEDLSPKTLKLYKKLAAYFGSRPDSQCIVFVAQRHTATVLNGLFHQIGVKHLRSGTLVGISSGKLSDMNSSFREQMVTMAAFRNGEINCLFATSVAEEGIDIPGCNLVIRFDLYGNLIEYVQSRGRARRQHSVYAHMLEYLNPQHREIYDEVTTFEKHLMLYCKGLDKDRLLDDEAFNNHLNKVQYEEALKKMATNPKTKARLTTGRSLPILEQYTNSLQYENAAFHHVLYNLRTEGMMFQYQIVLPEESPVQGLAGGLYARKMHAKQDAAFNTCLALRRHGLLDDYWNTVYRKRRPEMANARLAISSKKKDQYSMLVKPQHWARVSGQKPKILYVTTIQVIPNRPLQKQPAPIALLTRAPLPAIPTFPLYLEEDIECEVRLTSISTIHEVTPALLDSLTNFSFQIFLDVFHKQYERDDTRMPYWLAPLRFKRALECQDDSYEIDLDSLNKILLKKDQKWAPGMSADLWSNTFLVDRLNGKYRYFSKAVKPGIGPRSPVPAEYPPRRKQMNSLIEYSCSVWGKNRPKFMENDVDPCQPVFAAELVDLRRNFLDKKPKVERKTANLEILVCPQNLELSSLPLPIVHASHTFPAIFSRIEAYLIAIEASQTLDLDVLAEWALEALTKDSDNTEDHQTEQIQVQRGMGKNYERLEFLGDAFLKMATSISLFVSNPKNDEYDFHVQRMTLVCNQNLFDGAVHEDLQLTRYIRTEGFNRDFWYPESLNPIGSSRRINFKAQHSLGMKSIADVCEAMIGAALLSARQAGNLDMAVKAVTKLVHHDSHTMLSWADYSKRYDLPLYQTEPTDGLDRHFASTISSHLGYNFRYPRLLRSALTHPSVSWSPIPNYQRLEFLGDSLFDMVAIEWLFHQFPDRDPQWLTEHKMAMVSNKFLAAVAVEIGLDKEIITNGVAVSAQMAEYSHKVRGALDVEGGLDRVERDYWTEIEHPPKCLSDVVESYLGAIFVDSDFNLAVVEDFFHRFVLWHFEDMAIYDTYANAHPTTFLYRLLTDDYGCREFRVMTGEPYRDDGGVPKVLAALLVHEVAVTDALAASGKTAKVRASEKALQILNGMAVAEFRERYRCDCHLQLKREGRDDGGDGGDGVGEGLVNGKGLVDVEQLGAAC